MDCGPMAGKPAKDGDIDLRGRREPLDRQIPEAEAPGILIAKCHPGTQPPAISSNIAVVTDFGRSIGYPRALSQVMLASTPMARPTPNMTV